MATSREERMQQRMRGAGRHEVADDSFGFVLPGVVEASPAPPTPTAPTPAAPTPAPPPPPPSIPRSEPNTSAKRRRLNPEAAVASSQPPSSAIRSPPRSSTQLSGARADPYSALEDDSPENVPESSDAPIPASEEPQVEDGTTENIPDVIRSPEPPSFVAEEVTESPAHAPGSGQRRSIRVPESLTQSARLLKAATDEDGGPTGEFELSSPLARKSRASAATTIAASARSTRTGLGVPLGTDITKDVIEEVSPVPPPRQTSDGTTVTKPTRSTRSQNRVATPSEVDQLSSPPEAAGTSSARKPKLRVKSKPIIESAKAKAKGKGKGKGKEIVKGKGKGKEVEVEAQEEEAEVENEVAEEVNIQTAAKTIGRKRPRVSVPREASPELHSKDVEDVEDVRPAKKSKQRRVQASPAKQSKPKAPKSKDKPSKRRRSDGEAIPIIVQRYTKRMHLNEGDSDADILNADIPFANRGGVNVIDVLAQVCEEVIDSSLETLHEAAVNAKDPSSKKEFRTKLRALEAFQEELRTRLLEHTIALDTMHALKKRVRSVQKEKLTLRTEIMRIRAEREQVALKMDAVRIRHEAANRTSLYQLGLSTTMDDIELAVENGRSAPELNTKEKKTAELANLELLIDRIASQASGAGDGGGSLNQIKDFNSFLERAAAALERR